VSETIITREHTKCDFSTYYSLPLPDMWNLSVWMGQKKTEILNTRLATGWTILAGVTAINRD
jgi:hypothetical protein